MFSVHWLWALCVFARGDQGADARAMRLDDGRIEAERTLGRGEAVLALALATGVHLRALRDGELAQARA